MKYCIVPRIERERCFLQERLVPEYDERLIIDYVSPVPEDKEFQLKVMAAQPTSFEKNEFRELAGFAPHEELEDQFAEGASASPQNVTDGEPVEPPEENLEELEDEEAAALYLINRKLMKR
jgi:hypothetical protein